MYFRKIVIYLIYGVDRSNFIYKYLNREIGYGYFDLLGIFNIISGIYRNYRGDIDDDFIEYYCNKLFVRILREIWRSL